MAFGTCKLVESRGGEEDRLGLAGGGDELLPAPFGDALLLLWLRVALVPGMRGDIERFMLFDSGDRPAAPDGEPEPVTPCSLDEAFGKDEDEDPGRGRDLASLLDSLAGGVGGGLDFLSGIIRPTFEGEDDRRAPIDCVSTVRPPLFDAVAAAAGAGLEVVGAAAAAIEAEISLEPGTALASGLSVAIVGCTMSF